MEPRIINATGLEDGFLDRHTAEIAAALADWKNQAVIMNASGRGLSLFDRHAYEVPDNPYREMAAAKLAVSSDDVVGAIADFTESMAFQRMKWECEDPDTTDVFNQMATTLDLDSFSRVLWRELFTYSQVTVAERWAWQAITVRGKSSGGTKRKKKFSVFAPGELLVLDPLRVVPVGGLAGGQLAWIPSEQESVAYDAVREGKLFDPVISELMTTDYRPNMDERDRLAQMGVNVDRLFILNPERVTRLTLTKASYERWPDVRLRSTFRLLDLKNQLIDSDRVTLIGSANYILLVKKGTKDEPPFPQELRNLTENFQLVAKIPVIVSDHRLSIEIIAPPTDFTLKADKYDTIDHRLIDRTLGTVSIPVREGSKTLSSRDGLIRGIESRRHLIGRYYESRLARNVVEHPANAKNFPVEPNFAFVPSQVSIQHDPASDNAILQLRRQFDLSRETLLEYFGFDQSAEAQRREHEEEVYDDIFQTAIPFTSPAGGQGPGDPTTNSAQGGPPPGQPNKAKSTNAPEAKNGNG